MYDKGYTGVKLVFGFELKLFVLICVFSYNLQKREFCDFVILWSKKRVYNSSPNFFIVAAS